VPFEVLAGMPDAQFAECQRRAMELAKARAGLE